MTVLNTPAAWSEQASVADRQQAVRWSAQGQAARFRAVLGALEPQLDDVLLDFGCGLGALATLLPAGVRYVGYDWATGMIRRAKALADHSRDVRFTSVHPHGRFDLVACVGPFNLADNWSKQHTWHTLRHLWDSTGCRTLAASLYAGDDSDCLSYTTSECQDLVRQLTYRWSVHRHRPNDLLLVAHRW